MIATSQNDPTPIEYVDYIHDSQEMLEPKLATKNRWTHQKMKIRQNYLSKISRVSNSMGNMVS